jgi:hypothetical protein
VSGSFASKGSKASALVAFAQVVSILTNEGTCTGTILAKEVSSRSTRLHVGQCIVTFLGIGGSTCNMAKPWGGCLPWCAHSLAASPAVLLTDWLVPCCHWEHVEQKATVAKANISVSIIIQVDQSKTKSNFQKILSLFHLFCVFLLFFFVVSSEFCPVVLLQVLLLPL